MIEPLYQSRAPVAFEKPISPVQRARKLGRGRQQVDRRVSVQRKKRLEEDMNDMNDMNMVLRLPGR
jgi:hypothetical protein